jgi:hypothetical protein
MVVVELKTFNILLLHKCMIRMCHLYLNLSHEAVKLGGMGVGV